MNITEKYQVIRDTVKKYNAGKNPSSEDINRAFSYFHELIESEQYPCTKAEAMQLGSTLSAALSNINGK